MQFNNMKTFTGIEYMAIDIANHFGLDKKPFEYRIQWVKDNLHQLEDLQDQVDEDPILYAKAVMAFRRALNGEEVGHMPSLDAVCSGIQIMSAITGCQKGAYITGLIDPDQRMDAYKFITDTLNVILKQKGIQDINVARKDAKDAIMPCTYGSQAKPKEYFGEGQVLEAFYMACHKEAKGTFELLQILRNTWQRGALAHTWQLPDGFVAQVKVMQKVETRVHIAEMFNYNMTIESKVNQGSDRGVSNVANVIHSIDAFLLRELIRRCNYNKNMTRKVYHIIKDYLLSNEKPQPLTDEELKYYFNLANQHGIVSVVVIPHITSENVDQLHRGYLADLLALLEVMLSYEPFMVTTVHDAFCALPNNCNVLRHWYREILAELADSDVLEYIIKQVTHNKDYKFHKHSTNLSSKIRKSNYAIC
ncbi:DNA-directed RNA polymerase [Acinetobacter sp. A47]|uniref:DNA-directed RNA polymerase n=1 Tax=Acinetobacter sp. A47 TaxID=1561217 RepID=UPI00068A4B18|nr:DNA-directed RNA polymerase [Acinetobacter sp. A47]